MATSVTFEPAQTIDRPTDSSGGDVCEVCGTPLYYAGKGRHPRFCDEHKKGAGKTSSGPTTKRKTAKKRAASEAEWQRFLSIGLLMATYCVGRFAAGGQGLMLEAPAGIDSDTFDGYAESLAMSVEEVTPIANLVATRATPSKLNKRAGWVVVNALELEEVGEALWTYGKRVGPIVASRIRNKTTAPVNAYMHTTPKGASNGNTGPAANLANVNRLIAERNGQPPDIPNS